MNLVGNKMLFIYLFCFSFFSFKLYNVFINKKKKPKIFSNISSALNNFHFKETRSKVS